MSSLGKKKKRPYAGKKTREESGGDIYSSSLVRDVVYSAGWSLRWRPLEIIMTVCCFNHTHRSPGNNFVTNSKKRGITAAWIYDKHGAKSCSTTLAENRERRLKWSTYTAKRRRWRRIEADRPSMLPALTWITVGNEKRRAISRGQGRVLCSLQW